jgi:uncharacterized protein YyaL (SSP411 family)
VIVDDQDALGHEREERITGYALRPVNRLAKESSPYLLLHAENPVDWYPWGDEAFEQARREDKPLFLSIGYSTCYWCHVMERESFSDPEIARALNEGFVSIKLDREERPELDEIYMTATQLLTQSGGWPNSLFLTHDGKPFFAGTYFPPEDRHGRPGFVRVLSALREAWAFRRAEVLEQAEAVAEAIRTQGASSAGASLPEPSLAAALESALARRFDHHWGGFGRAPKFPSPSNLCFLLDRARGGSAEARTMLVITLDRMARGGIFDQLAGGFHRYATDAEWLVPHFEKMLYDNAALAPLYAEAAGLAPASGFARVARATLDFVLAELCNAEGGLLSAIDAETDGHEGAYYTWSAEQLTAALDPAAHALLAPAYGFDGPPNFEGQRYVLHLAEPLRDPERIEPGRRALLAVRSGRKRPLTDDKVLTDWNGLAIGALARCGALLPEPRYLEAARRAAQFVLEKLRDRDSGELRHAWRGGVAKVAALLDDYAFLVAGLLELHSASAEPRWLEEAQRLVAEQDRRLWDAQGEGYFNAGDDPRLLVRSKAAHDGAVASGQGIAALNLLALAERTGQGSFRERAERLLRAFGRAVAELPVAHVSLVRAVWLAAEASRAAPAPPAPVLETPAARAEEIVMASGRIEAAAAGTWRPFRLELRIREGWHVNANPPLLRFLIPTEVKAADSAVRALRYPEADRYEGSVVIEGEVEVSQGGRASVRLTYQPCDEERCLTPVTRDVVLG